MVGVPSARPAGRTAVCGVCRRLPLPPACSGSSGRHGEDEKENGGKEKCVDGEGGTRGEKTALPGSGGGWWWWWCGVGGTATRFQESVSAWDVWRAESIFWSSSGTRKAAAARCPVPGEEEVGEEQGNAHDVVGATKCDGWAALGRG